MQSILGTVRALPDLMPSMAREIEPRTRQLLSTEQIYGLRQVILTGSGDSYIAATAAAPAFRAWTGLPAQALPAMEASRYLTQGGLPVCERLRGALIVCVSHSGEAARSIEAAQRGRLAGGLTVAVTANPQSRLGLAADKVLAVTPQDSSSAPGTASYCASLLALYLLGIRIAEVRMRLSMEAANALREQLAQLGELLRASIASCEGPLAARAQAWGRYRMAQVLGSGPGGAAAAFTAAKLMEAAGVNSTSQDIEEFFHLSYFIVDSGDLPTIVFAPSQCACADRALDVLKALAELQRPCMLITDDATFGPPDDRLVLPRTPEMFIPLLYIVPAALLAAFWADRIDAQRFRRLSRLCQAAAGAPLIRGSTIETLPEGN